MSIIKDRIATRPTAKPLSSIEAISQLDGETQTILAAVRDVVSKYVIVDRDHRTATAHALSQLYQVTHLIRSKGGEEATRSARLVAFAVGADRSLKDIDQFEAVLVKLVMKIDDKDRSSLYTRALRELWKRNIPLDQAEAKLSAHGVRHFIYNQENDTEDADAESGKREPLKDFIEHLQSKSALATVTLNNEQDIATDKPLVLIAMKDKDGNIEVKMGCINDKISGQVIGILREHDQKARTKKEKVANTMATAMATLDQQANQIF